MAAFGSQAAATGYFADIPAHNMIFPGAD